MNINWNRVNTIDDSRYYLMYSYDSPGERSFSEAVCFLFNEGYMEQFAWNEDKMEDLESRIHRTIQEIRDLL